MKRRRTRRVLKWATLSLSLAILLMWVTSKFVFVGIVRNVPSGSRFVGIGDGALGTMHWDTSFPRSWSVMTSTQHVSLDSFLRVPNWIWDPSAASGIVQAQMPLCAPFLLFALSAAALFYIDRRRGFPPGHCGKCGYNRTGLKGSDPCPECGHTHE